MRGETLYAIFRTWVDSSKAHGLSEYDVFVDLLSNPVCKQSVQSSDPPKRLLWFFRQLIVDVGVLEHGMGGLHTAFLPIGSRDFVVTEVDFVVSFIT